MNINKEKPFNVMDITGFQVKEPMFDKYLDKVCKIKGRPYKEQSRNSLILTDLKLGSSVIY